MSSVGHVDFPDDSQQVIGYRIGDGAKKPIS
jgi:hypothetical protein